MPWYVENVCRIINTLFLLITSANSNIINRIEATLIRVAVLGDKVKWKYTIFIILRQNRKTLHSALR